MFTRASDGLRVNEKGDLQIGLKETLIVQYKPFAYQDINGKRVEIESSFSLAEVEEDKHIYSFNLASYDKSYLLVIDPSPDNSTYLGARGDDEGHDKTVHFKKSAATPIPSELIPALIAATKDDIPEAYHAKRAGLRSLKAKNPAQELDFNFSKKGIKISSGDGGLWTMRLASYTFDAKTTLLKSARPKADGIRVEYNYDGLTEWYMNSPYGLEQGFTVEKPASANAKELSLAFKLDGKGSIKQEGDTLLFTSKDGGKVRYGDLMVIDANGRKLASHFTLDGKKMAIVVDVANAAYPITVDPLFSNETKLLASDGAAWDLFGRSVSIDGDYAIVGANLDDDNGTDSGSAYVFIRSGASWSEQDKLTASDGAANDIFGISVCISGDYAIVGAYLDDDNGTDSGSAYVYFRSGATWSEQAKLIASDGAAGDLFGLSVSVSGDYAIVGSSFDDDNGALSGSAYVFIRSGASWSEQDKLTASDGAAADYFGRSVSIDGDYAIVGAYLDDDNGTDSGSAYVFLRTGASWGEQAKLIASDGETWEEFGGSVSIDGDYAIIGASDDDDNGTQSGSAYVFIRSGTSWSEQAKLLASDGWNYDYFGNSVSISGDYAIVGAHYDDDNGTSSGSAYIFKRTGTSWSEYAKLLASDGATFDWFGNSVSIDGVNAIVGAWKDDDNGSDSGSAYIFETGLTIDTSSLSFGIYNTTYAATVMSSGGDGSNTFSVASGTLPTGLSLNTSTGVIGGTPTVLGSSTFSIQVTDGNSNTDTQAFTLTIYGSLMIDYSTFLGGTGDDQANGIAIDSTGAIYVSGLTSSTNLPTASPIQASNGGGLTDAYITKLNADGSALVYSTYLGGTGAESGYVALALDSSGNAYVTGHTTSTDFPTASPIQGSNGGLWDAFITKVNAAGSALVYSTYLGGSSNEYGLDIAVDSSGRAYITGYTGSFNFPTASPIYGSKAGVGIAEDPFVTRINSAGTALEYSTYLGGSYYDYGISIAVDSSGSAYVAGETWSTDFPTSSPIDGVKSGLNDAFVTKISADGSGLDYSTYLGGSGKDWGMAISVDSSGSVYVAGATTSTNFPTVSPIYASHAGSTNDVYVAKINSAGSALVLLYISWWIC